MEAIVNNILSVQPHTFSNVAIDLFHQQYAQNQVYRDWVNALNTNTDAVKNLSDIPFLPVSFFKSHEVVSGYFEPEIVFESSGTTVFGNSRHLVKSTDLYTKSFLHGFNRFYGDPTDWCILGLLPSYLDRQGSSLVYMVEELIKQSRHKKSGFYLYDFANLATALQQLEATKQKTMLIGVTFALLDFATEFPMNLQYTIVMETGGMKGRRKEMIREELHAFLQQQLKIGQVHSEYGMTELLSQGYSLGNGIFNTVPWMKVLVRDEDDPLLIREEGRGLINVIDLANVHSCSFIATDDVGRIFSNGSFEVLGRRDNSDIRGCSLMVM